MNCQQSIINEQFPQRIIRSIDESSFPVKTTRTWLMNFKQPQNIVRLIGSVIILVSTFLPFYSTGGNSLGSMVIGLVRQLNLDQTYPVTIFIMVLVFVFLLLGGISAIFSGKIGVLITFVAMILSSISLIHLFDGFEWVSFIGFGYYGPWLGIIAIAISGIIGRLWGKR